MAEKNEQPALAPHENASSGGVGARLKAAREAAGFTLAQMADQTKIPVRMLSLVEAGDFAGLPARTYATGFTRTYARQLGLDEKACVAAVRAELGMNDQAERPLVAAFEPGDPGRVPSARLAWLAAVAALVVIAAGLFFWRTFYSPAVSLPSLLPQEVASAAPSTAVPTFEPAPAVPAGIASGGPDAQLPAVSAPVSRPTAAAAPQQTGRAAPAPSGAPAVGAAPAQVPVPAPASTAQN